VFDLFTLIYIHLKFVSNTTGMAHLKITYSRFER